MGLELISTGILSKNIHIDVNSLKNTLSKNTDPLSIHNTICDISYKNINKYVVTPVDTMLIINFVTKFLIKNIYYSYIPSLL